MASEKAEALLASAPEGPQRTRSEVEDGKAVADAKTLRQRCHPEKKHRCPPGGRRETGEVRELPGRNGQSRDRSQATPKTGAAGGRVRPCARAAARSFSGESRERRRSPGAIAGKPGDVGPRAHKARRKRPAGRWAVRPDQMGRDRPDQKKNRLRKERRPPEIWGRNAQWTRLSRVVLWASLGAPAAKIKLRRGSFCTRERCKRKTAPDWSGLVGGAD